MSDVLSLTLPKLRTKTRRRFRRPKLPDLGDLACLLYVGVIIAIGLLEPQPLLFGPAAWALSITFRGWGRPWMAREFNEWNVQVLFALGLTLLG